MPAGNINATTKISPPAWSRPSGRPNADVGNFQIKKVELVKSRFLSSEEHSDNKSLYDLRDLSLRSQ